MVYSILYAPITAWGGFDKRMFSGLGLNLRLGLAGIAMVGSEWWCWEIVGLATSYLGPTALAAQSVLRMFLVSFIVRSMSVELTRESG